MVKVSDFVINYLYKKGIKDIFLLSGGGNIHLIDSIGRSKMNYICNHHEQAAATAAEGYARTANTIGACLVTTGPGSTNAITGVAGSWLDSIPIIVISGQVKRSLIGAKIGGLRQLGSQEINIIDIVKPITKYAVTVMNPADIQYHVDKALFIAKHGRQGPVWLDIPLDVQGAVIDEKKLKQFSSTEIVIPFDTDKKQLSLLVSKFILLLQKAKRPVLYVGNGIRLAHAEKELLSLLELLKIPVITSYVGYDLVPSDHPYFFGRAHSLGQRAANFIVQNSDLFISIGARLDILTVGFTYQAFARAAYKIMVDIDKNELNKDILSIDLKVNYDAKQFIAECIRQLKQKKIQLQLKDWFIYAKKMQTKYSIFSPEFTKDKKFVNQYYFIDTVCKYLQPHEVIVLSDGIGPLNCSYQVFTVKKGQRVILNLGGAQMGYGLPAAIGACFANQKKRVICFDGDGSLQLNIHELQVVKQYNLPIKLFVYSNDGYQSIVNTQNNLFEGRHVASNGASGVTCPDYVKIGRAFGIKTVRIRNHKEMVKKIRQVLAYPGPVLCDINTTRNLVLTPKLMTRKTADGKFISPPLEDMGPFLSREELKENMIIDVWKE